jgi:hypothetical protein
MVIIVIESSLAHISTLVEGIWLDQTRQALGVLNDMSVDQLKIEEFSDLLGNGSEPNRVYEICIPESECKDYLISQIPRGYEQSIVVHDREFSNLDDLVEYLGELSRPLDLVVLDVSEVLYLDYIKDYGHLRRMLREFYKALLGLSSHGTACVVFSNFSYYGQIRSDIPEVIQIRVDPSEIIGYWRAVIVNPLELRDRTIIFRPFESDVPFLLQF